MLPALMMNTPIRTLSILFALLLSLTSACGGGGGSADASGASAASSASSAGSAGSSAASSRSSASSAASVSSAASSSSSAAAVDYGVTTSFSASTDDIPNPERGFYRWTWAGLDAVSSADMKDAYTNGYRLVYSLLRLDSYRSSTLPDSLLTKLDASFANARANGVKLVIRAAYNYPEDETGYQNAQDASLAQVQAHLAQLAPVLARNADVIAFVQAGFIGAWGEWHTSSNNLLTASNRAGVRDALLSAVPASRFVQIRYASYLMDWTPTLPALSSVLAGNYRLGMHNDCFLASNTDVGTYSDTAATRASQRSYVAAMSALAPFGGETCNPADESAAVARTSCDDILGEGATYHLSYLNYEYYRPLFHENWTSNGCMADVRRKMGYRLQLVKASHPASVVAGASLPLSLSVLNAGWARPFNPRGIRVLLRNRSTLAVTQIDATGADPRSWLPGDTSVAALVAAVPAAQAAGTYDLLIAFPDPLLASDVRYAIRPANADNSSAGQSWDATLGAFATGSSLVVTR